MASLLPPLSSLSSPSSSSVVFFPSLSHRLQVNCVSLHSRSSYGVQIQASMPRKAAVIVRASNFDGEAAPEGGEGEESKEKEVSIPVENLPLESKMQMIQEQRMKMKLAKKIRLRRKRLVRKRHLRKKGRWPPSKMKKNKNV